MRLVLVTFALALAACQSVPASFSEHLIATIPEGVDVEVPIAFTRDGLQAAYVARASDGCRAVRGTWKSARLDVL